MDAKIAKFLIDFTIGNIASLLTIIGGAFLSALMSITIKVAQFSNITNNIAIIEGWIVVRDICNMFFILVLLLIAFATILQLENYSMKRWLPKLIFMVILINFSRMFVGLLIDASQIVMLTFVNAFADGGGSWWNLFNVTSFISDVKFNYSESLTVTGSLATYFMGVIFIIISVVAMIAILMVFVMRIIMLWIYTVLSPFGFFLMSFPGGAKYASQYWGDLIKYLINGPVLAFFIWLAMATISNLSVDTVSQDFNINDADFSSVVGPDIVEPANLIRFVLALAFLGGGLMVSSQIGGAGSSWGISKVNQLKTKGIAMGKAGTVGSLDWVNRKIANKTGLDLNMSRNFAKIKAGMEQHKREDLRQIDISASRNLQKGGMTGALAGISAPGWADHHLRGFLGAKGIVSAVRGSKKRLDSYSDQAEENNWKAKHTFKDETEYKNKRLKYEEDYAYAEKEGDDDKMKEIKGNLDRMKKHKSEIVGGDKQKFLSKAQKLEKIVAKRGVMDYYGQKAERQAIAEESKNITSTNEDELVAQFQSAVAKGNAAQASALAEAIAKVGGANAMLEKFGYQAEAGFTAEEAEKHIAEHGEESYQKKKGFNDFMRDIFQEKLGMNEQAALRLQNDLGGIGENIGHEYLIKSVHIDKQGRFYQNNRESREKIKLSEKLKREAEGVIRKNNRLEYGAEDIHEDENDNFRWSDSGMAYFISNIGGVAKEIEQGRFNRSAARSIAQKTASGDLKEKLVQLGYADKRPAGSKKGEQIEGVQMIDDRKGHYYTIDEFLDNLNEHAAQAKQENFGELLKKV